MSSPTLSIVIPTWNEEHWLARLLNSIQGQQIPAEIVVADFDSSDRTREIAEAYGCKVVPGGRPAVGRNNGARASLGDILVFIDADTELSSGVLKSVAETLSVGKYGATHFRSVPISTHWFHKLCYVVMDHFFRLCDTFGLPRGVGSFVAVTRSTFESIGGFDERLTAAEDLAFWRSAAKFTKVKYVRTNTVFLSPRRFRIENQFVFALKCTWYGASSLFVTRPVFPYRWLGYSEGDAIWERQHWIRLRTRSVLPPFAWPDWTSRGDRQDLP